VRSYAEAAAAAEAEAEQLRGREAALRSHMLEAQQAAEDAAQQAAELQVGLKLGILCPAVNRDRVSYSAFLHSAWLVRCRMAVCGCATDSVTVRGALTWEKGGRGAGNLAFFGTLPCHPEMDIKQLCVDPSGNPRCVLQ
jgi:hypothetical protein